MGIEMHIAMGADMCFNMCISIYTTACADMCTTIDVRIDMFVDMSWSQRCLGLRFIRSMHSWNRTGKGFLLRIWIAFWSDGWVWPSHRAMAGCGRAIERWLGVAEP